MLHYIFNVNINMRKMSYKSHVQVLKPMKNTSYKTTQTFFAF